MTLGPSSAATTPIRVRTVSRWLRVYMVVVFGVCGGFFALLAWHQPSRGHEMGYALGFVMLWMSAWAAVRPEYAVEVTNGGFDYTDERFGFVLYFPRRHANWPDVTRVDTRVIRGRYGHWLRTRVWVRDAESSSDTRRFSVRSSAAGYQEFIDLLTARVSGQPVEMTGYGLDTQRALADDRSRRGQRAALALALIALAILAAMLVMRRR